VKAPGRAATPRRRALDHVQADRWRDKVARASVNGRVGRFGLEHSAGTEGDARWHAGLEPAQGLDRPTRGQGELHAGDPGLDQHLGHALEAAGVAGPQHRDDPGGGDRLHN
jgi:hypothetical protein